MIVVSNTSPLTNLAAIGQFDLLHRLFDAVHIPDAVWGELCSEGKTWPGREEVASAEWVEQHTVRNQTLVVALTRDLDQGEAEAIALALELNADLVLLDEKEGRRAAERHGLEVAGVVGLLLRAKDRGMISETRPHLLALRTTAGFWLADSVYHRALALAGEQD